MSVAIVSVPWWADHEIQRGIPLLLSFLILASFMPIWVMALPLCKLYSYLIGSWSLYLTFS